MLSLAYELEREIIIGGVAYPIDLSFDNVLRIFDLLKDPAFTEPEKLILAMKNLLDVIPECTPKELEAAYWSIIDNLIFTQTKQPRLDLPGKPIKVPKKKPNYSLTHDADYIYASFLQAYGIDLLEEMGSLDWAKFNALLNGLPDDTKFKQVIEIRERPFAKGKGAQKENEALRELKRIYELPDDGEGGE